MLRILFIVTVMFVFCSPATAQEPSSEVGIDQAQQYIKIFNAVPLMDNLYEVRDSALVFDKPNGRIAEIIYFSDSLLLDDVKSYYTEVLPQLGWVISNSNSDDRLIFNREQEVMTILASKRDSELVVKFNVFPYENPAEK